MASGSVRHEFKAVDGNVTALAFSRDGKTLAGGCSDTTIYLWDLAQEGGEGRRPHAANLDSLWKTFDGTNAKKAERGPAAAGRPAGGGSAVPEGAAQAGAGREADPAKIEKMIADLDSPRYAVREAAMRDLEQRRQLSPCGPVQEALKKTTITAGGPRAAGETGRTR